MSTLCERRTTNAGIHANGILDTMSTSCENRTANLLHSNEVDANESQPMIDDYQLVMFAGSW